jgi:hypothetical protein
MLKHEVIRISPKLASEYLEKNTNNRPVSQTHVDRLAKDMSLDRWKQDGSPIKFSETGALLDGQHRLRAIIKSGVSVLMLIVTGLDPDSFVTMDSGRRRSTSDALHIKGEQYYTILAPAINSMVEYLNNGTIGRKGFSCTTQELIDAFDAAPGLRESAREVASVKGKQGVEKGTQKILISLGQMTALHYLFSEKDRNLANEFINGICFGFDYSKRPAFHKLRERLIGNQMSKAKLPKEYIAAICVKCWNAERKGVDVAQTRFSETEDFPVIR